jgi:hypothetical protein
MWQPNMRRVLDAFVTTRNAAVHDDRGPVANTMATVDLVEQAMRNEQLRDVLRSAYRRRLDTSGPG